MAAKRHTQHRTTQHQRIENRGRIIARRQIQCRHNQQNATRQPAVPRVHRAATQNHRESHHDKRAGTGRNHRHEQVHRTVNQREAQQTRTNRTHARTQQNQAKNQHHRLTARTHQILRRSHTNTRNIRQPPRRSQHHNEQQRIQNNRDPEARVLIIRGDVRVAQPHQQGSQRVHRHVRRSTPRNRSRQANITVLIVTAIQRLKRKRGPRRGRETHRHTGERMVGRTHVIRVNRQTPTNHQHVQHRGNIQERRNRQQRPQTQGTNQHRAEHNLHRIRAGKRRHRIAAIMHTTQVARQQNIQRKRRRSRRNVEQNRQHTTGKTLSTEHRIQVTTLLLTVTQEQRPMLTQNVRNRRVRINLIRSRNRARRQLLQHVLVVAHHIRQGGARNRRNARARSTHFIQSIGGGAHLHGARRNLRRGCASARISRRFHTIR